MDAYWQSELSVVFGKECPSLSPKWHMGRSSSVEAAKCQKACAGLHVCIVATFEYALYMSGGPRNRVRDQSIWTPSYLWENEVVLIRGKRLPLRSFEYANEPDSAPADGSIGHGAIRSTFRACMMAEELCKLASCVSGIQMALNLCLLCSPAQRRRKEKREKGQRTESFSDDWKPQVVCINLFFFITSLVSKS